MTALDAADTPLPPEIAAWFAAKGWRVRRHQWEMLAKARAGRDALLVADTGAGKTLAGFLPTLADFCPSRLDGQPPPDGLHTLYVSPLKALAHDVQRNLLAPVEALDLPVRIETRSGDTPSVRPQAAPAQQTAAYPADHSGILVAAAVLS